MIHNPKVKISCDNKSNCPSFVLISLKWTIGGYDIKDDVLDRRLRYMHNWIVDNENERHYCSEHCQEGKANYPKGFEVRKV